MEGEGTVIVYSIVVVNVVTEDGTSTTNTDEA